MPGAWELLASNTQLGWSLPPYIATLFKHCEEHTEEQGKREYPGNEPEKQVLSHRVGLMERAILIGDPTSEPLCWLVPQQRLPIPSPTPQPRSEMRSWGVANRG